MKYICSKLKLMITTVRSIFKPHEAHLIRHKILEYLYTMGNQEENYQKPKLFHTITDISEKTLMPYDKIHVYHEVLNDFKEIKCYRNCDNKSADHDMKITPIGRQAYINGKYLKEAKNEKIEIINRYSAVISPVVAVLSLVVTIIAVPKSCTETPKESKIRLQIESKVPELKIQELKEVPSQPKYQGQ